MQQHGIVSILFEIFMMKQRDRNMSSILIENKQNILQTSTTNGHLSTMARIFWPDCALVHTLYKSAKKVLSDSPGLVDFSVRLVHSIHHLLHGRVKFWTFLVGRWSKASEKGLLASTQWLQLAQRASWKICFLCTLQSYWNLPTMATSLQWPVNSAHGWLL